MNPRQWPVHDDDDDDDDCTCARVSTSRTVPPSKHSRINKLPSQSQTTVTLNTLDTSSSTSTAATAVDSDDFDDNNESNGSDDTDVPVHAGGRMYPSAGVSPLNPSAPMNSKSNSKLSSSTHTTDVLNHHHHHSNHYQRDPLKEPWFIIVATLTVMFILSSGVLIFLMRARSSSSANNKTPVVQHINVSMLPNDLGTNNGNGKIASSIVHDSVWIDHSWFNGGGGGTASNGNQSNLSNAMATSLATMFGSNPRIPSSSSKFIREITCNGAGAGGGGTGSSTLEDTYSEIESNDYAVVADIQNLSTFKSRAAGGGQSSSNNLINSSINNNGVNGGGGALSHRSNSPGPYATTNLINITPNALYRVSNDITNCKSYRGLNPLVDHISSFTQLQPQPANGNGSSNGLQRKSQQQANASPYHKLKP